MTKAELELQNIALSEHNGWMEEKVSDLTDVGNRMTNWLVTWAQSAPVEQKRVVTALVQEWRMATEVSYEDDAT
jgi:hypothetical protein